MSKLNDKGVQVVITLQHYWSRLWHLNFAQMELKDINNHPPTQYTPEL